MELLPAAFYALKKYNQFVVYRLTASKSRPGKTDKIPVNPLTGANAGINDTTAWLSADDAIACAKIFGAGYGVGFVFTKADPFWFIDIDNCITPDNKWSPIAEELLTQLAGCAVEVSQSGRGLHIIGSGELPPHGCRNVELSIELYSYDRFVALTGNHAAGCASFNSQCIKEIATRYFTSQANSNSGGDVMQRWRDRCSRGIDPGATVIADDAELIRRASSVITGKTAFSGGASFADLWHRNVDALAVTYPDPTQPEGFNESHADAALAQHLCFWTGRHAERTYDLMMASGLRRDKYDRPDYLPRTIVTEFDRNTKVYNDGKTDTTRTLAAIIPIGDQAEFFKGCIYVENEHRILAPRGRMLKPEAFKAVYGGHLFPLDASGSKLVKDAFEAFTQSQVIKHERVETTCFRPDLEAGAVVEAFGSTAANIYWSVPTARTPGNVDPFLRHVDKLCPVGDDAGIIMSYMAAVIQHMGVKFQWAPLIQGVEGNGKSLLSRCVAECVGQRYTHYPKAAELASKFNDWLYGKVFISVEDIYVSDGKMELWEAIKPMITNSQQEIEPKGGAKVTREICANFIINTNHKDGLRKTRSDRRIAPFYTAQQSVSDRLRDGMTDDYFKSLWAWLKESGFAAINDYLRRYAIPDQYNPATSCLFPPLTSSTGQAIEQSGGRVEQEIEEAVALGEPGFRKGWISSVALDHLLEKLRISGRYPPNKRRELLKEIGYRPHPELPDGRTTRVVLPDAKRPRLYTVAEHRSLASKDPATICKMYEDDQK